MLVSLLAAAGLLLVPACSAGPAPTAASLRVLPEPTPRTLSGYYGQDLRWHKCGSSGFQCATMKAPLDYAHPASGDVKLAVSRKKATGSAKKLGSLLVNPGGPGGSAVGYLQSYAGLAYPKQVRERYDMVAADPRGVAGSEPVECLSGKQMDRFTETDTTPDDPAEVGGLVGAYKVFAKGCQGRSGRVLGHVSTVESARDMDLLRSALGDRRLTYVGASYGTFLGATYADLFPKRVGRLVLDGAMDPSLAARRMNLDQTAGFETAFRAFARDCVKRSHCPLGTESVSDASSRLKAFFAKLDKEPLPTSTGRQLGESLATSGVIATMYDQGAWPQLRRALDAARTKGEGSKLLALSDTYYERGRDGSYANLMFANAAVNCLDLPPAFKNPAEVKAALPEFEKASPVFGKGFAWASLNCTYWPVRATGEPHRSTAKGAPPILVVGTTRDPATPYRWAKALASQLDSGTLLTHEGDGHTAYGRGSACVDAAINRYLLRGTPPTHDKRCT
ncbi:proteinase [Streptomyces tsukubensis]|uniref:Proteinase n=1 Tax=Streptomyces tsukubensis TaxID=83656 RepID=A0A1V4AC80_9ACTN|nr:proteinase [Streptomyces tsukubensis]